MKMKKQKIVNSLDKTKSKNETNKKIEHNTETN